MTWELRHGRYQDVLADVECDAVIVDAPYSAKTHGGHDRGTRGDGHHDPAYGHRKNTEAIPYSCWSASDVAACVALMAPRCRGWFVSLTDHTLAPVWAAELEGRGLYTFSPLPIVEVGSRVRLSGDGPSSWVTWVIVARPRTREFQRWGTLRGAYLVTGRGDRVVMGGKRTDVMRALVRDYTRPGDVVCDPCAGGGTTGRACQLEGRHFIGAEMDPDTWAKAHARLSQPYTAPLLVEAPTAEQVDIFAGLTPPPES